MDYPSSLPKPLQDGYAIETVDPVIHSRLASGRIRQRVLFDNVPQNVQVKWTFTRQQAQLFVTWFRWNINNGVDWFNMPLRNEFGCAIKQVRFSEVYKGPTIIGPNLLGYTGILEIYERETLPEEWSDPEFAEWILYSDIFDLAMNREWPEV